MTKKITQQILQHIPIFLLAVFLIAICLLIPHQFKIAANSTSWAWIGIGIAILLAIILGTWLLNKLYKLNKYYVLIAILLLTIVPRLIWIAWIPTEAVSDYYYYNVIASYVADHNSWSTLQDQGILYYAPYFTHILNFSNLLSVVYKIFGNAYLVGQLYNIVITGLTAILLYIVISKRLQRTVAIGATLIFMIWPAYFMYSTLLGTEPTFLLLFVASIYIYMKMEETGFNLFWILSMAAVLVLMNLIRPLAAVILIAFIITALLLQKKRWDTVKKFGLVFIIFLVFTLGQSTINKLVYQIPTANSIVGYNVFIGANEKTGGQWSKEDSDTFWKLYQNPKLTNSEVDKELLNKGIKRYQVMAKNGDLFKHMKNKLVHYSDEGYGYSWNIYSQAPIIWDYSKIILQVSNVFLYLMLVLNFGALILAVCLRKVPMIFLFALFQLGFILSGLLVEVQGRYHIALIIGSSILTAWFLNESWSLLKRKLSRKQEELG
ncbi:glycosyltransferase family 39 protein [Listeria booriae]|uniref:ArnT family glycosyltransferase n=1 Tax=Listeria booriae TaxID=1552123 RepID=UPI001625043D|nr:glycosyltransferase family 39 protein [Listeria booriae]MBC2159790.1 glycosyltransferase family 39 protein [Listeria booriae]MBC2162120.1 glycosyltransferase family 39 protein [Listeria booriae]MBC2173040.1 glycosyltransferase family 39 protein [Listeria booriae]MBC2195354.1 glycosyltransferase family 39 protein [Listeria booriae]